MSALGDDIKKYHEGKLSAAEMHALEKKGLSDPFLADALEGSGAIPPHEFNQDIDALQQKIRKETKVILFTPMRIAAGIAVLVGATFLIVTLFPATEEKLASKMENAPTPASVATDSLRSDSSKEPTRQPATDGLLSLNNAEKKTKKETKPTPSAGPQGEGGERKKAAGEPAVDTGDAVLEEDKKPELLEEEMVVAKEPEAAKARRDERVSPVESLAAGQAQKSVARVQGFVSRDTVSNMITGRVMLKEDGLPLPGVNVLVKGTTTATSTDFNGRFSLPFVASHPIIAFSFIGLETQEIVVHNPATINVTMIEDVSQLSEVVVTGMGHSRDDNSTSIVKLAEPQGGRRAYNQYLENNLQYPVQALEQKIKGKVTIQFTVRTDGALGEFQVLKSLGYGCDDEVVRLVKQGPTWRPSTENAVPVESLVRVRMKFDPAKVKK